MKREVKVRRKRTRKQGPPLKKVLLCMVLLGSTIFFTWEGMKGLQTTAQLRLDIEENKQKISELGEEKEELEEEYKNLSNPDYARYYAMGKYHVTQDGEQVFVFPQNED